MLFASSTLWLMLPWFDESPAERFFSFASIPAVTVMSLKFVMANVWAVSEDDVERLYALEIK